jgi:hypothetical protein
MKLPKILVILVIILIIASILPSSAAIRKCVDDYKGCGSAPTCIGKAVGSGCGSGMVCIPIRGSGGEACCGCSPDKQRPKAYILVGDVSGSWLIKGFATKTWHQAKDNFLSAGYKVILKPEATEDDVINALSDSKTEAIFIIGHGVYDKKTGKAIPKIKMNGGDIEPSDLSKKYPNIKHVIFHSCGQKLEAWKKLFPNVKKEKFEAWSIPVPAQAIYYWQRLFSYEVIAPDDVLPSMPMPVIHPTLQPKQWLCCKEDTNEMIADISSVANDFPLYEPLKSQFGTQSINFYVVDTTSDEKIILFGADIENGSIVSQYVNGTESTFDVVIGSEALFQVLEEPSRIWSAYTAGELQIIPYNTTVDEDILFRGAARLLFGELRPPEQSVSGKYNIIKKDYAATVQSVLIGQSLDFFTNWGVTNTVTIYRVKDGVEWTKKADQDNTLTITGGEWTKDGSYYVNYNEADRTRDAQLTFSEPDMPLALKVGTKEISSMAQGTPEFKVDTAGMNLFDNDVVDLVIKGPEGQIKIDMKNNQTFTGITVSELKAFGTELKTDGWKIGDYTFQVKTKSAEACGLDAVSAVKTLRIMKGEIAIDAEPTSTIEYDTVTVIVTGVAGDKIEVVADPCEDAKFLVGVDDTPPGATCKFDDTIDSGGVMKYAITFSDTGTYTLRATVTGPAMIGGTVNTRIASYDTVDITVLEKAVEFDMPDEVVIGDKIKIRGTSSSGTHVSVYVDDTLYKKLVDIVIEDGEFDQEVKTTDVGMDVPGSVRLKAWIDCDKAEGEERPTRSPDGEDAILLSKPTLTACLSVPKVALEDDFKVLGTAKGQTEVTILSVPPKGGGGKSLLDKGQKGLSPRKASVSTTDDTFSRKMTVQEDATAGYYDIYVLCAGMDDVWGMTGEADLEAALDERDSIPSLTEGVITTKTQEEIEYILDDLVNTAGAE